MKKIKGKQIVDAPSETFDYDGFEKEAISRLNGGASLVGPDGVLTGLIQRLVNVALSGKADSHIREGKAAGQPNRRNGHTSKVLDTELGTVPISPPRDRAGSFEPQLVGKWERQLGTGLDKQILTMYANGNSYGDIQHQVKQLYGLDYSPASIAEVTELVWAEVVD